jgi:hypothetical protein
MNGAQTKATKRQIRKAFGDEALDTIAHLVTQLRALEQAIHAERMHRLDLAKEQRAYVDQADTRQQYRLMDLERLRNRGFFGRLRWLLRGE